MTPALFDETGKPIRVLTRIGKGGEGEVYSVDGADLVVKYYTIKDLRTRELKVRQMLANELASKYPLVAFPRSLAFDKSHRFVGFTMAKIASHKPLHELYAPRARKVEFPQANYRFLTLCAANISRAIGSANASGCVVGDINHSGILVSTNATVTLIDADSFQIGSGNSVLPCLVGVPEYTPPELQGVALSNAVRTVNHDAFGLAIAIFQLLFMGRHPFSGTYSGGDMPLERAIKEYRFAYSLKRSVGMAPPPGVPTLKDFSAPIAEAFENAFGPTGPNLRPTAKQWMALLDELKDQLRVCSVNNLHQYPPSAATCPWCRMEQRFLVPLFLPFISVSDLSKVSTPAPGDVNAIWRVIEAVQAPVAKRFPQYSGPALVPRPELKEAGKWRLIKKVVGWTLAAGGVGVAIYAPDGIVLGLISGGAAWLVLRSKDSGDVDLTNSYRAVQTRIYEAESEWDRFNSGDDFANLKNSLKEKKDQYEALPRQLTEKLNAYSQNRRTLQLDQYLSKQLIRNFQIPKVGTGRRATLLSYGIETAADVSEAAVLRVPGFGPKTAQPLFNWRRHLESRFAYNPSSTPEDNSAIGSIRAEISQKGSRLKAELAMGPARLSQLVAAVPSKQAAHASFIEMLLKQRAQLVADFNAARLPLPQVERPAPKAAQPATANRSTPQPLPAAGPVRCPRCGGAMVIRRAQRGPRRGSQFYGCARFPACVGTRPYP